MHYGFGRNMQPCITVKAEICSHALRLRFGSRLGEVCQTLGFGSRLGEVCPRGERSVGGVCGKRERARVRASTARREASWRCVTAPREVRHAGRRARRRERETKHEASKHHASKHHAEVLDQKKRQKKRPSIMARVSIKIVRILVSCNMRGMMSTVATYTNPPAISPCVIVNINYPFSYLFEKIEQIHWGRP
jgi:hypothetical protein